MDQEYGHSITHAETMHIRTTLKQHQSSVCARAYHSKMQWIAAVLVQETHISLVLQQHLHHARAPAPLRCQMQRRLLRVGVTSVDIGLQGHQSLRRAQRNRPSARTNLMQNAGPIAQYSSQRGLRSQQQIDNLLVRASLHSQVRCSQSAMVLPTVSLLRQQCPHHPDAPSMPDSSKDRGRAPANHGVRTSAGLKQCIDDFHVPSGRSRI
mmetsp:Transcript_15454/g.34100  ORF Transcript_15454/g.34100 Transcript_15454/m.34100 type:complete len:209 (-) Transcript_15454:931-1557(-)